MANWKLEMWCASVGLLPTILQEKTIKMYLEETGGAPDADILKLIRRNADNYVAPGQTLGDLSSTQAQTEFMMMR